MPAFLVPVDSGQCLIPLEKAIVLIGRQSDCDVSLTHSRKISRKHCCIAQVNNKFVVRDLGSTNGIFLNGTRIEKEATIKIGDDLVIGDVHFKMQNEAPAVSRSMPKKKETGKVIETAEAAPPTTRQAPPRKRPTVEAAPSLDIPIALPDGDLDFEVDATAVKHAGSLRKNRIDDVVPLNEDEEAEVEDVLKFASDSF